MSGDYDLDNAYEIHSPQEARKLYDAWAATYDNSFGEGWGYIAPREIARLYAAQAGDNTPILDIGAGTGLVAEHLGGRLVDGVDISPKMMAIAKEKAIYRDLIEADLTKPLPFPDNAYGGVISCGTFTHGHVGPECLPELLRVTRPGSVFVCGTIPAVYDKAGFGSALALFVASGAIEPVSFADIPIYEGTDHPHASDRGLVMIFRTC